jgi:hypothetical protein
VSVLACSSELREERCGVDSKRFELQGQQIIIGSAGYIISLAAASRSLSDEGLGVAEYVDSCHIQSVQAYS